MKQFKEHRPGYFSGFENQTYNVNDFAEVLEIPFVKGFSQHANFYSYAVSVDTNPELPAYYKLTLMALYDWDEEYNGCKTCWVVGYLPGFIKYETELKAFENLIADHKPTCWLKKYQANENLLDSERPEKTRLKVLKELGWQREDTFGIAVHCDCGYKKK